MTAPFCALRYMTRFRCTAQSCEDTCCAGMKILLTAGNRERLEAAMGGTPGEREELAAKVQALATPQEPGGFGAVLAMRQDGTCSFLDADRSCSVWRRYGEQRLPDACSLFPRVLSHIEDRVEVAATLACPEAARLCLLGDGAALDLVEAPSSITERVPPITRGEPEPYVRHVEEVRACGLTLLRLEGHPVPTRVAMIAVLGERLAGFFHRGAPAFDPALLRDEQARALRPEAQEEVWRRLDALEVKTDVAIQAILGLLTSLQPAGSARYNQLVNVILGGYLEAAARLEPSAGTPGGPGLFTVLQRVYEERRARLDAALGGWLTRLCMHYCLNEWHREWYTHSPDLLSHAFKLLLRLASIRFLLAGHPLLEQSPEPSAIEVFQIFTKQVERDPQVMPLLDLHLTPESLGVDALGRALLFAKAC